jgi:competence protein ComEC
MNRHSRALTERERGSLDYRLLPPTLSGWAASLATHLLFEYFTGDAAFQMIPVAPLVLLLPLTILPGMLFLRFHGRLRAIAATWHYGIVVCMLGALICASCALTYDLMQYEDASFELASANNPQVVASIRLTTPITTSDSRMYDCQADCAIMDVTSNGIQQNSLARARIYADRPYCMRLKQGGAYRVSGKLSQSQYGAMPLWLTDISDSELIRAPNPAMKLVDTMQQAFFAQTSRLSDQGRILVPGLTLGVLGQDYVPPTDGSVDNASNGVNATYAKQVESAFRKSGILHLMAVSGGHLVVIAALVKTVCSFFLVPRRITALLMSCAYVFLAICVYPSDSVSRALIMGLASAAYLFLGRRGQSLATLCWTTLAMLIIKPYMSQSFGFALSCAAVLGIVLFASRIHIWLQPIMPAFIAESMSMTVAAQLFTLPIQVLIEPELPVFSIPANLIVAPLVSFSTLAGLSSLFTSWAMPTTGFLLACMASWGTAVMEYVSRSLGTGERATIAWSGGIQGALLICAIETACAGCIYMIHHLYERTTVRITEMPGRKLIINPVERLRMWNERTMNDINHMKWQNE